MGLEELLRGFRVHFRRYDAEQIILNSDHIDGGKPALVDDYLQGSRELLVLLALPMKIDSYGHIVQDERRPCKHCGEGFRIKVQLVI